MASVPAGLFVCAASHAATIQIKGRANFGLSPQFKTLVTELKDRGATRFVLDLAECSTMDSTFLGVLAGLAIKLSEGNERPPEPIIELFRPNQRILELLENLGIAHFFKTIEQPPTWVVSFKPADAKLAGASKEELSKTCLEAHETLMAVNPGNIPKFKEVTQFLAEDLKKTKS